MANISTSTRSSTLADVLERILDKGIVIAGDIKIKLVDIELLTIQIRLLIASVDKAKELGIDWWFQEPFMGAPKKEAADVGQLQRRILELELQLAKMQLVNESAPKT